jgi:hypothetical protein
MALHNLLELHTRKRATITLYTFQRPPPADPKKASAAPEDLRRKDNYKVYGLWSDPDINSTVNPARVLYVRDSFEAAGGLTLRKAMLEK